MLDDMLEFYVPSPVACWRLGKADNLLSTQDKIFGAAFCKKYDEYDESGTWYNYRRHRFDIPVMSGSSHLVIKDRQS